LRLDAIIAAKLAYAIMMQDGGIGGYVQGTMTRDELPDEVVPCLHYILRLTDVFGALLVRMQLGPSPSLPQGDQAGLSGGATGHHERIVGPL